MTDSHKPPQPPPAPAPELTPEEAFARRYFPFAFMSREQVIGYLTSGGSGDPHGESKP